jgi:hypothetical protein
MIYAEMGRLQQQRNDITEALAMYDLALDYDPNNVLALNSMGLLHTHKSKSEQTWLKHECSGVLD